MKMVCTLHFMRTYRPSALLHITLVLLVVTTRTGFASSMDVHAWSTGVGDAAYTLFFPTETPPHAGTKVTVRDMTLPYTLYGASVLTGDVDGTKTTKLVGRTKDPLALVVIDPLSGNTQLINLEPNPHSQGIETEQLAVSQLVDYDGVPGLEAICWIGLPAHTNSEGRPGLHQVVSIRDQSMLTRFYGYPQSDMDGDGFAAGSEGGAIFFRDSSGAGKFLTAISMSRPDLQPRELRIYDADTGEISSSFQMATPFGSTPLATLETGETNIFIAPWTPDNQIPNPGSGVNVSADLNGTHVTDRESYLTCLQYDPRTPGQSPLTYKWSRKRGEFLGGYGLIFRDSTGRLLTVAADNYIRAWDWISPGGLHVTDLITGEVVLDFFLEPTLSFASLACALEGSDIVYTGLHEKPAIAKFDVSRPAPENPVAFRDFSDLDPTGVALPVCITDMNGDGSHDLVVIRTRDEISEVVILNSELEDMDVIEAPLNFGPSFGDADNDGYPEMYIVDPHDASKIRVIEYTAETSETEAFEAYP